MNVRARFHLRRSRSNVRLLLLYLYILHSNLYGAIFRFLEGLLSSWAYTRSNVIVPTIRWELKLRATHLPAELVTDSFENFQDLLNTRSNVPIYHYSRCSVIKSAAPRPRSIHDSQKVHNYI